METKMLLPNRWKKIGWFLLIPSLIYGVLYLLGGDKYDLKFLNYKNNETNINLGLEWLFNLKSNNFTDEIIGILLLVGLILTAFSKEKIEDEWVAKQRLDSILWAVYLNTILVLLCIILLYGSLFWQVMIFNLFSTPLLYLIRFQYVIWQSTFDNKNEIAL
jgi:hypothetical protein